LAARETPLLVLDDLHWADTPSLLLLQFLARELNDARLFLAGAYRARGAAARELIGSRLAHRLIRRRCVRLC
jgi:predicted ATPase